MKVPQENHFYITPTDYHDNDAKREAISFSINKAESLGLDRVIILTPTKSHTGFLESAYGEEIIKPLQEGHRFENGMFVKLESLKTYSNYSPKKDFVVCFGFSSEELFKIEDENSVKAVMAVPSAYEIEEWTKAWGALEIRSGVPCETYAEPICPVRKGLDRLHSSAFGGTSNSSDQYKMKTFARVVHAKAPSTLSQSVGSYLLRKHKWDTEYALYVQELLGKLQNGKTFQGGDKTGLGKIFKDWESLCKEEK